MTRKEGGKSQVVVDVTNLIAPVTTGADVNKFIYHRYRFCSSLYHSLKLHNGLHETITTVTDS